MDEGLLGRPVFARSADDQLIEPDRVGRIGGIDLDGGIVSPPAGMDVRIVVTGRAAAEVSGFLILIERLRDERGSPTRSLRIWTLGDQHRRIPPLLVQRWYR